MDIEKLTEEAEKLKIEPRYDTNWCDLPPDIKLKCIETFELKERLHLRTMCKMDRELVDSLKMNLHFAYFTIGFEVKIRVGNNRSDWRNRPTYLRYPDNYNYKNVAPMIEFFMKIGTNFQTVTIDFSPDINVTDFIQKPKDGYTIKKLEVDNSSNKDLLFWLESLKNGMECIKINANGRDEFPYDKLPTIPGIINTNILHIYYIKYTDIVHKIAQAWIDNDAEIGRTFLASTFVDGTLSLFYNNLSDRKQWIPYSFGRHSNG